MQSILFVLELSPLLWRNLFLIWKELWTLCGKKEKKNYVWIVPWSWSLLFVSRLKEKSIPGLWIRQTPPFSTSSSYIAIVFKYWLETKKIRRGKKTLISGHSHNAGLAMLANMHTLTSGTFKMGIKQMSLHPTPAPSSAHTLVFTNEPSSPSLYPSSHTTKYHPSASRRSLSDGHILL